MKDTLSYTDEEILEIAHELRIAYKLKNTIRYGAKRDPEQHVESVAEHIFALIYLAHYFLEHEPSAKNLDRAKVYDILLFHDFGEIKHGDISYHIKTQEDRDKEFGAAKEIFASLPEPLDRIGKANWEEYEEKKTPEAKFADAIDKIEPMFELLDPMTEKSMKRLKFNREMHLGRKYISTEGFPFMRKFVDVVANDMEARDVFWKG
jgi:putative hydrolase of HD superfamily